MIHSQQNFFKENINQFINHRHANFLLAIFSNQIFQKTRTNATTKSDRHIDLFNLPNQQLFNGTEIFFSLGIEEKIKQMGDFSNKIALLKEIFRTLVG